MLDKGVPKPSCLQLVCAIMIHKSQGMTLDRAVINIGEREFARGLTFVALSRVQQDQWSHIQPRVRPQSSTHHLVARCYVSDEAKTPLGFVACVTAGGGLTKQVRLRIVVVVSQYP